MRIVHGLRKTYWRLAHPTTLGSRCLVLDGDRILLVRHVGGPSWYLPGGGVKRGETFAEAACREVFEECGLTVSEPMLLHLYLNRSEGKIDHVAVFASTRFSGHLAVASAEIAEAAFFPLNDLPSDASPATRRRISEYLSGNPPDRW